MFGRVGRKPKQQKMSHKLSIGTRVGYVGPTIEEPWLPRGTEGVVTDNIGGPFEYVCDFNIAQGDDWPMTRQDLEVIRG